QGLDPIASEDKKPPRLCQLVRRRPPCILDNLTHDVITHSFSCVVIAKHGASLLDEGVGLFGRGKCAHRFSGKALFWKKTFVDAGDNVQRILIVDLLKYIVRQVEAIHPPKGMVSLMVWEIVVGRFKYPEICLI